MRLRISAAVIVEVDLPDLVELDRIANLVQMAEAAFAHGPTLKARPGDFSDQVRHGIEPGFLIPATSYIDALALRPRLLRQFIATTFADIDVLQLPVLSRKVPTLAETDVKGLRRCRRSSPRSSGTRAGSTISGYPRCL